ncbi:hypothetical protein DORFOR_02941 [Dorea formicigenerans ATCC 27755]|uniref:Uncharacterized protein n=1 Tax=Dorea formicigenerans ATCC 27755 TaxID=411461 RepID=B0G9H6_9FIRM|nr:hypothetical protein DORFOR_02941 [Dorea formicigenerans ATCC 27755]
MVVVSHLFLFLWKNFRDRCDLCESHLSLFENIYFPIVPCFGTIYFPTVPLFLM